MALPPDTPNTVEDGFTADRAMFWSRFTTFTKFGVGAVIALMLFLLIFIY